MAGRMKCIAHKAWLDRTWWLGHTRSVELKGVDRALEVFGEAPISANELKLKQALQAWKKSVGPGDAWKKSERNKKRAVEELDAFLGGKEDTDKLRGESPTFMHADLANARLGVVYLFANAEVESNIFNVILEGALGATQGILGYAGANVTDGGMGIGAAGDASGGLSLGMIPGSKILDATESAAYDAKVDPKAKPAMRNLMERARAWFESFIKSVWSALKEKFATKDDWIELGVGALKGILNFSLAKFAEAAAPFVSGALDLVRGVVNTLDAIILRVKAYLQGKGVALLSGHPSIVVDGIKRGMNLSIGEGLYQTLKGAGNIALTGAAAGAGMVVNVVVSLGEMIVKVLWRLMEIFKMDRFFGQAKQHWRERGTLALHTHPIAFENWFRDTAVSIPAISVLTLNSGICGDKMRFLQMYKSPDGSGIVTQDEFDRGCAFVDSLKGWGSDYLKKCGYGFKSDDKMVASLLDFATKHSAEGNRVWNAVKMVANA